MACGNEDNLTMVNASEASDNCSLNNNTPVHSLSGLGTETGVIFGISVICSCTSGILNSALLWASNRVDQSKLRAKFFVQNLSVVNLILPFVAEFHSDVFNYFFGPLEDKFALYYDSVHSALTAILFLVQPACSAVLAFDRMYSVARPFRYSKVGYAKVATAAIIMLPWITGVLVWGVFVTRGYIASPTLPVAMVILDAFFAMEDTKTIDIFLMLSNSLTISLYIVTMVLLKRHQHSTETIFTAAMKRKNMSLVVTFFLVNLTSLMMYLPAPAYSLIVGGAFGSSATEKTISAHTILLTLYLGNCILDPTILISRIPSIRQHLPCRDPCTM